MDQPDLASYIGREPEHVLLRLAQISAELIGLIREIATVESQRLREFHDAYRQCEEPSDAARKRYADAVTVDHVTSLVEMIGDRDALTEEKFFLIRLLDGGSK